MRELEAPLNREYILNSRQISTDFKIIIFVAFGIQVLLKIQNILE